MVIEKIKFAYHKIPDKLRFLIPSIISGMALTKYTGLATTNIVSLIILIFCYFWYSLSNDVVDKRTRIVAALCSVFFSSSFILVKLEEIMGNESNLYIVYHLSIYIIGFFVLFKNISKVLLDKLSKVSFWGGEKYKIKSTPKTNTFVFVGSILIVFSCWFIFFLRDFPGNATTDSYNQIRQALGDDPYSNHHPVAHTLIIKLLFNLGLNWFDNNQNAAFATYSIFQMLLLAASFSYFIVTMYKFRIKKIVIAIALAFYALVPYHAIYSITIWKDVWFGGIIIVITTTIWRLIRHFQDGNKKLPIFEIIMLFIFGICMCLFRSNGLYAYILLVPFLFMYFRKKNIAISIVTVIVLPIAFIVKGPVYNSMDVTPPDAIESLSIPAQHIAKYISDGKEITVEEADLLFNIVDVDMIPERYNPNISDSIKDLVRETNNQEYLEEHKGEFLMLWLKLGLRRPSEYLYAQISQTYGYWYPDVQYWVYAAQIENYGYEFQRDMKISEDTNETLSYFVQSYKDVPYWGLLWSIGSFTWCGIFMLAVCVVKKRKSELLLYIPIFAILGTLMIATPVFAEFRYAYSMFTTMPVLCVIPFAMKLKSKSNDEVVETADMDCVPVDMVAQPIEDVSESANETVKSFDVLENESQVDSSKSI